MSDADTVRALADRAAITDQLHRYCRSMDRIDVELGYSVFHDDAEADYGPEVYQGTGRGFIDAVLAQHRGALNHSHQVTSVLIELDGDRASSEAYVVSALWFGHGDQVKQAITWGRYIDRWSKRGGRWAIDKRVAIRDLSEIRDVVAAPAADRGRRDRSDPSYEILKGMPR